MFKKKLIKFILSVILIFLILCALTVLQYVFRGYFMYKDALEATSISDMVTKIESKEDYTLITEVPAIYKNAVVAVEDHRFYEHEGIDIIAILGAIVNDLSSGKLVQGGSTITQQLCKNIYFTQDRKIERKIAEIFMAHEIEDQLEKDKILELYINTCYYGGTYYTLKSASFGYFDTAPSKLTNYQATMLAGVPNAPALYNPKSSLKLAKERQIQVLNAMVKYKYITKEEKNEILNEKIDLSMFEE